MTLCAALLSLVTAAGPSGVLTRPPELQHFVEAVYPPEDLAAHREAEVTMEVEIDEAGAITGVRKSSVSLAPPPTAPDPQAEERFARAALEAAAQFHFSPAEIDGKPAPVQLTYRYRFTIQKAVAVADEGAVVIEGRLLERGTRRALAAASVSVEGGPSVEADAQGRFALRGVTSGHRRIRVVSPDHEPFETSEEVRAGEKTEVTYYVRRRATSRYEAVVQGERDRKEVAKKSLSLEEIKRVPGTSGDAVAVVQMLPGVARAPYGLGLLPVRGTRPGDTLGYVDGITIPNVYHFGGLPISVMNADALSGLDFYPGNFSARFGRALGGTIELRSRPGATTNIHGYGDISLLEARALVEAPTGENSSFLATARRSYVDLVLSSAGSDSISPRYYDYLVRHDWKLKGGRAAVYGYGSSDALTINKKGDDTANPEEREGRTNSIAFHRLQGLYEKAVSDRITARVVGALGYDDVDYTHGSTISAHARFWSLQLRAEADWTISRAFQLTAGLDGSAQRVSYSVLAPIAPADNRIADPILARQTVHDSDAGNVGSPGAYLYATWSPLPPLRLVPGVRADAQGGSHVATVGRVDPRLALFYDPAPWLALKAAAGIYSQPPPIRRGELTRKFGNPDLRFQESRQYMVGATTRFGSSTTFDVQAYYKDLSSIIIPSDRIVERAGALQQENYSNGGSGFSRGVEVMLREELSSGLLGWISYTLSQSRQKPAEGLAVTDFLFDQRHNLYVMISQKLPRDWTIGASLRYTTGGWYTPVTLGVYDSDGDYYQRIEGKRYSRRQPYFLELDARVDKRWVYERWSLGVYLDVRNVTNRRNVEDADYSYDYTQRVEVSGLPLFPNLGVRGEF
jgi:hypothetical protein